MQTKAIEYQDGNLTLKGYFAFNETGAKQPLVIIFHDWTGRNEFACKKAEKMVELGYAGFAVDMYGAAKLGKDNAEKSDLIKPFLENHKLMEQRILAGYNAAKKLPQIDPNRIATIGFCFGGFCALNLARTGVDLRGVVSFHGFLHTPEGADNKNIKSKILALHGYKDPMVTSERVFAFEKAMSDANIDWQLHIYGQAYHAFMNPLANDYNLGLVYNALVEKRAWNTMKDFFAEIF